MGNTKLEVKKVRRPGTGDGRKKSLWCEKLVLSEKSQKTGDRRRKKKKVRSTKLEVKKVGRPGTGDGRKKVRSKKV